MRGIKISMDGKRAAWTWYNTGPAADVYAAPTDGSTAPVRLTNTEENTIFISWTPNNESVLVYQDKGGDERYQIFRVDLTYPLTMIPLTEVNPNHFLRGGNLHPNGRWLVYGANLNVDSGEEIEATWIYRHDLESGVRFTLARPVKGGYILPELNHKGTHVIYTRMDLHPAGEQIWLVDIEGTNDREILNFGHDVKTFASWFPDGERVLFLSETKTHRRLGIWALETGETRWLLDDPNRNIERAFVPFKSDQAVIVEVVNAQLSCTLLNPETGNETHFPEVPGNLLPLAPLGNGDWVGQYYSSRQPMDLVRFQLPNPDRETFVSLAKVWECTDLTSQEFTPAQDFHWKAKDGLEIQGWLYKPEGKPVGAIVYVHGGPTYHSEDSINNVIQFFVNQGFTVLDPNYRGSTGFNQSFREAIKVDGWGGMEQEDIRAGIEALIETGIAEPGKVGITGTSYGGYSAWCAITRYPPEIIAAAAPVCGMTDLVVDYETTRPDLRPLSEEMMGGSPEQVPDRYFERSPIYFVENIKGKLLIVQGGRDPNVTPENVRVVRESLEKTNIPYEILVFDDEGHGISKPKNQKELYLHLTEFFEGAFSS
jgi:dipeptidyl aminopeptidase/acylaminoacyl peptidase